MRGLCDGTGAMYSTSMSSVAIASATNRRAHPGDLGAHIAGGKLWLPGEVAGLLARLSIRTAEDLVAYLASFPSAVAAALDWRVEEVEQARAALVHELEGHLDETLLHPAEVGDFPLGAFDPARLESDE